MEEQLQTNFPQVKHAFRHSVATVILFVALLCIAGEYAYVRYHVGYLGASSNPHPFELIGTTNSWYMLSGGELKRVSGPIEYSQVQNATIVEAAASSLGTMALAEIPGKPGAVLGYLKDGVFTPRIADGVEKSSLVLRPDGFGMYTQMDASSTIEVFNARNPSQAPYVGGSGRPLGVLPSGKFVVVSQTGLQLLDPENLSTSTFVNGPPLPPKTLRMFDPKTNKTTWVPVAYTSMLLGAVSPDADYAVLANALYKTLDVYTVDGVAGHASYQYSIPMSGKVTALGFWGDNILVAATASSTASVYTLSHAPGVKKPSETYTIQGVD